MPRYDALVVGAGFAGVVCAEQLADAGRTVLLIDRRSHVGGNAHDQLDPAGVLVHTYGPHIFHTNSRRIFEYLSRFTRWRFYEHRVQAVVDGLKLPIPINRTTLNTLYGLSLQPAEVGDFLQRVRTPIAERRTSEDVLLDRVGPDLCDKFYRGYTLKHWGCSLADLDASVVARIAVRTNDDDRYFDDAFQFMPVDGFSAMFRRMLAYPKIDVALDVDYFAERGSLAGDHVVFTGSIDAYFDFQFGRLPYRSIRFEHEHLPNCAAFQDVGTVNYPNDHAYTRITEFRHLTGQDRSGTSIVREFPTAEGDPYYPIPRPQNHALYMRYRELAKDTPGVTFVGRLAEYKYYNMDQVVGSALAATQRLLS